MEHLWIEQNYSKIVQWAKNMTKNDQLYEELAHYAIEQFITHKRYEEIMQKHINEPDFGHCRGFILAIMRNSWYGKKSEFTRYHKAHRADIGHRKRNVTPTKFNELLEEQLHTDYDFSTDYVIEAIDGILEEMSIDTKDLWYQAKLFQMWLENPNFSALSRQTDIPRTSISNAVQEAKEYIKKELKNRGIDYEL
jgi:hypothetical protein